MGTPRGDSEMKIDPRVQGVLRERLRRAPGPSTVPGSLPILFFGDLFTARIATVGLNPSDREFLDRDGRELDGPARRFETLASLGAASRGCLSDEKSERAIATMRAYYRPGKPVYGWFRSLDRVTRGMGFTYECGDVAHLDLVQEATHPTWSRLNSLEVRQLRAADEPFLNWQLATFPLEMVVCNGRTVFDGVRRLTDACVVETGTFARLTWSVALADMPKREPLIVVGWNIPLARPTGLNRDGHVSLGQMLLERGRAAMSADVLQPMVDPGS